VQAFTATASGMSNPAVTWSVNPPIGSLSASGVYTAPAFIAAAQTILVTATSIADPSKSASASIDLTPVSVVSPALTVPSGMISQAATNSSNSALFLKIDKTTQGNWKGVYGANGYNVVGDTVAYPSYVKATPSNQIPYVWSTSTTDARALQSPSTAGRI